MILQDVTTWALTHFEPLPSWSVAEDFTPTEEQEGYGLIGRGHRMSPSDYRPSQMMRGLRDIANPKVRGSALWTAHALLTTCHSAASDRSSGNTPQDRQAALLSGSAPASHRWLAQRQAQWPPEYRRTRWIEVQKLASISKHHGNWTSIAEGLDRECGNRHRSVRGPSMARCGKHFSAGGLR